VEIFFENRWPVRVSDSDPYPHEDLVLHGTVQYLCGRVRMSISAMMNADRQKPAKEQVKKGGHRQASSPDTCR